MEVLGSQLQISHRTTGGSSTAPRTESFISPTARFRKKILLFPHAGTFTTAGFKEKTTKGNTKHRLDNRTLLEGKLRVFLSLRGITEGFGMSSVP